MLHVAYPLKDQSHRSMENFFFSTPTNSLHERYEALLAFQLIFSREGHCDNRAEIPTSETSYIFIQYYND